jgi:hypothetical protein
MRRYARTVIVAVSGCVYMLHHSEDWTKDGAT